MNLAQLLVIRLRLDRGAHFRFFHSPTVYAYLMDRLGTPPKFPKRCFLLAPESGRSRYDPGDEYRFGLVLLRGAEVQTNGWVHRLRRGPRSPFGNKLGAPLGKGTRLVNVVDGVTGEPLPNSVEPEWLTLQQVERAAFALVGQRTVTLTFHSPLLILRTPVHTSKFFMDDRVVDGDTVLKRVRAKVDEHFSGLGPACDAPPVIDVVNGLARADARYPKKTLMGSIGSITLELGEPLTAPWARALVLAGLVGIGKSTAMGQGRYSVEGATPAPAWPPTPVLTHCQRAARSSTLVLAREALLDAGERPGVDGMTREAYLERLRIRLPAVQEALAQGRARASALRGTLAQKAGGGLRPVASPTMQDRFLQRCCSDQLAPSFGQLLEDSRFAHRQGLSRERAPTSVRRAHADGFVHVLDTDLRRFFDIVDWVLLERRLRAYLAGDPMVDQLMRWVKTPVRFGAHTLTRTRGLPPGSVLSPLLATLVLDPLEEAIEQHGCRLVRHADDFVVMCKSEVDMVRARDEVAQELEHFCLELVDGEPPSANRGDGLGLSVVGPVTKAPEPSRGLALIAEGVTVREPLGAGRADDLFLNLQGEEQARPAQSWAMVADHPVVSRTTRVVEPATPSQMTRAHWAWAETSARTLPLARGLVEAKIHNQRLVVRHQPGDNDRTRRMLKELAGSALRADSVEQLRGIEGRAAHVYFARWAEWTPSSFGFERRTGRHATDPINAVLNLLYTQLFRQCWMTTMVHGLDPHLGVLHESSDRYAALAADLQEPFRFLCERLVLDVIRRRRLTREHFIIGEKRTPPVTLTREGLTMILGDWEKRLDAVVKTGDQKRSYRDHINEQTARLAGVIRGENEELGAFRLKW